MPAPRVGPASRRHLIVMLKVPVAGRVKTRLARGIGTVAATAVYRHGLAALLMQIDRPAWWTTMLAIAPDHERSTGALPHHVSRRGQGRGDLGDRMQRIFDTCPPGPVVVIGTDVPGLSARHIREAFRALAASDSVIGPSPDGGYWLIGFRRRRRVKRVFGGVRWSSPHARSDTLHNLKGLSIRSLEPLADIDTAEDLKAAEGQAGRRILPR